jgi:SpoVK/Ycf46/Vps4 family AAA+-type ATPase
LKSFLGIPNSDARLSILSAILTSIPNSLSRDELESIANQSHGYVGADLSAICREAGLKCIKRSALLGIQGKIEQISVFIFYRLLTLSL